MRDSFEEPLPCLSHHTRNLVYSSGLPARSQACFLFWDGLGSEHELAEGVQGLG